MSLIADLALVLLVVGGALSALAYGSATAEWLEARWALSWEVQQHYGPDRLPALVRAERAAAARLPLAPLAYLLRAWRAWRGHNANVVEARRQAGE